MATTSGTDDSAWVACRNRHRIGDRLGLPSMLPYRGLRKSFVSYLLVLRVVEACVRSISTVTAGVPELSGVPTADAL